MAKIRWYVGTAYDHKKYVEKIESWMQEPTPNITGYASLDGPYDTESEARTAAGLDVQPMDEGGQDSPPLTIHSKEYVDLVGQALQGTASLCIKVSESESEITYTTCKPELVVQSACDIAEATIAEINRRRAGK